METPKESRKFYTQKIERTSKYKQMFTRDHDQECCEDVYVDDTHEDSYVKQIKGEFDTLEYWTCPEDGFLIKVFNGKKELGHIYYPCYNIQNGYYNDEIELFIDDKKFFLQELGVVNNDEYY